MNRKSEKPVYVLRRLYRENWSVDSNFLQDRQSDELFSDLETLKKSKEEWIQEAKENSDDEHYELVGFRIFERYELVDKFRVFLNDDDLLKIESGK